MKILKRILWNRLNINKYALIQAENIIRDQHFSPINETLDKDVFMAGFPKSGNTWMQNLITGILLDSESERISPQLVNDIIPDENAVKFYRRTFPTMIFKTHNLPDPRYKRVIHLIRDGRDAIVSYYNMEKNIDKEYKYSLSDMIKDGIGLFRGKWHIHTRSWLDNPFHAEIVTVKYEDLLENPLPTLKTICKFLNIELSDEKLMKIYDANNINKLRKKVVTHGSDYHLLYKSKKPESFFRKGKSGSYKDEMPPNLVEYFVKESKNELKHFGYIN